MKIYIKYLGLLILIMTCPFLMDSIIAQPPPPTPQAIPIDGGLTFLLVAGMVYGGSRLYKEKMQNDARVTNNA